MDRVPQRAEKSVGVWLLKRKVITEEVQRIQINTSCNVRTIQLAKKENIKLSSLDQSDSLLFLFCNALDEKRSKTKERALSN